MAKLDIAEKRLPQDGRISRAFGGRKVDVRVSTIPTGVNSERVVMRILDKQADRLDLEQIGIAGEQIEMLRRIIFRPYGILLVTGPTGSGKTTTLYAGLRNLNDGSRNILTVEDPVEYAMEGVGQTQVNAKVGLTFAAGLRAILRQDPDVVMVGEIRDRETAEIAVQASLTGHLVLSTVHTNDAVGAITRMRDMRVEPFLLASTLRAVVAQRLVRRLCQHCREPVQADKSASALLGFDPGTIIYRARGCDECNGTGYKGRIGVFEAIRVDDTIRRLINDGGDESLIARHAFLNAPNLGSAARALVRDGQTTAEEAIRVSRRDATEVETIADG
jgi:general secretion pathway protein E